MEYKVPQNIDQEDKILGPLTFAQFIYVLIGGGIILIAFALFDFALFLLVAIPVLLLTIGFALVKVQDQPFSRILMAFVHYLRQPKQRIWQDLAVSTAIAEPKPAKVAPKPAAQPTPAPATPVVAPTPSTNKTARKIPISGGQTFAQTPVQPATPVAPGPKQARKVPVQTVKGGA